MTQCMNTVYVMSSKLLVGCDHVINECCTGSMISLPEFHFLSVNSFFTNTYPIVSVYTDLMISVINFMFMSLGCMGY